MLGWSTRKVARWVEESLRGAPAGPVAVLGDAALGKALAAPGRTVRTEVTTDRALAAVVSVGAPEAPGVLEGWSRALVDGGVVVLIERTAPQEASRRALCARLCDLEQRASGKLVVTRGRIRERCASP